MIVECIIIQEILANDFNNFNVDNVRTIRDSIPIDISYAMTYP